jgi:hypothetical protein
MKKVKRCSSITRALVRNPVSIKKFMARNAAPKATLKPSTNILSDLENSRQAPAVSPMAMALVSARSGLSDMAPNTSISDRFFRALKAIYNAYFAEHGSTGNQADAWNRSNMLWQLHNCSSMESTSWLWASNKSSCSKRLRIWIRTESAMKWIPIYWRATVWIASAFSWPKRPRLAAESNTASSPKSKYANS